MVEDSDTTVGCGSMHMPIYLNVFSLVTSIVHLLAIGCRSPLEGGRTPEKVKIIPGIRDTPNNSNICTLYAVPGRSTRVPPEVPILCIRSMLEHVLSSGTYPLFSDVYGDVLSDLAQCRKTVLRAFSHQHHEE